MSKPGTKFQYTSHGWTLISACIEAATKKKDFAKDFIKFLHHELGLVNTLLNENETIIMNRAKYYRKTEKGLLNSPVVDVSYKWAGGGLISTVADLLQFGNIMLYSFKGQDPLGRPGYFSQPIMDQVWSVARNSEPILCPPFGGYGIGWNVIRGESAKSAFTAQPVYSDLFAHTGHYPPGATSILLIEPNSEVVVALFNNTCAPVAKIGVQVAQQFIEPSSSTNPAEVQYCFAS